MAQEKRKFVMPTVGTALHYFIEEQLKVLFQNEIDFFMARAQIQNEIKSSFMSQWKQGQGFTMNVIEFRKVTFPRWV